MSSPESLPPHFIKDMFGQDSYPLDLLLQDYANLNTLIRINLEYCKFPSNYHSRYANTDTYGNRIVPNAPAEYAGTVWLIGNCLFSGYAVEDAQTCAAFLQQALRNSGYPYRVVNLSCPFMHPYNAYQKLLEQDIQANDAVIIIDTFDNNLMQKVCETIYFSDIVSAVKKRLGNRRWYWDQIGHYSTEGYRITATEIFQKIRPALQRGTETQRFRQKYRFHLEKPLEEEIHIYLQSVRDMLQQNSTYTEKLAATGRCGTLTGCTQPPKIGSIVMNCNPFTLGHQYLVETVSRLADIIYLFVVEEDRSEFPFPLRFEMVQKGTAAFDNVFVLPSGKFMISTFTSPGYFTKENPANKCYDTFLDLKIFAHYIAPALNIQTRFVGTEPSDLFTAQYNRDMKEILRKNGIDVIEVPRKCTHSNVISAKYVRKLLADGNTDQLESYVPSTTIRCLRENRYI